ncbi:MAG: Cof-type HAD-IIB family hydrolase [Vulcanimicrobiaceae bacterium]
MSCIRLVAFDLDGTLVGRGTGVRERVRAAVERMLAAGVRGCVVTGRMYKAALPLVRELRLDGAVICYQGAAVVDSSTDEVLRDVPLGSREVAELATLFAGDPLHLQFYRNDNYYCEARSRFSDLYAEITGVQPIVVDSLAATFADSPATKAVVVADVPEAERQERRLAEHFGSRAYVTRSYPEFVEVLNRDVDKGEALRFVAARYGISMSDVLAIGDSWNDVPLLQSAGIGVAMGSAPSELLAVAAAVVAPVENDGVAEALEKYVFV